MRPVSASAGFAAGFEALSFEFLPPVEEEEHETKPKPIDNATQQYRKRERIIGCILAIVIGPRLAEASGYIRKL